MPRNPENDIRLANLAEEAEAKFRAQAEAEANAASVSVEPTSEEVSDDHGAAD